MEQNYYIVYLKNQQTPVTIQMKNNGQEEDVLLTEDKWGDNCNRPNQHN